MPRKCTSWPAAEDGRGCRWVGLCRFRPADSGCVSYGVRSNGRRWFVKVATNDEAAAALERAVALHTEVQHPVIVPLRQVARDSSGGPVLVYPWVDREVLYHPTTVDRPRRDDPASTWTRFRRQPLGVVHAAIGGLLDAHLAVAAAGFVLGDFYDGCLLWDDTSTAMRLVDLDEYRPGPYVATFEPSGSRRFMAPEERLGGTIDQRTTVFGLGRAMRLLLDAGDIEDGWRGSADQLAVVRRAIRSTRASGIPASDRSSRTGRSPRASAREVGQQPFADEEPPLGGTDHHCCYARCRPDDDVARVSQQIGAELASPL